VSVGGKVAHLAWSQWLLRSCDDVGRFARVAHGNAIVENRGYIRIGARTRFFARFAPVELRTGEHGRIDIGERGFINYGCAIHAADSVSLGDDFDIGPYCTISDCEVGGLDSPDPTPPRPIVIGSGAWLATRVIVRPGAIIGDGAVIGAGSVVEGEIPPRTVAVGNPARVIRHLDHLEAPHQGSARDESVERSE
jgi:acetyltransferase-like isoleucine patch superfamily enzyme